MPLSPEILKLELTFSDRIGIVADLARTVTHLGLNIISMEVIQDTGTAHVYIELAPQNRCPDRDAVMDSFLHLSGAASARPISTLPMERREKHYQAIFDGVSEGIIATDEQGRITAANPVACQILGYDALHILGQNIREIEPNSNILLECMDQRCSLARRESLVTPKGRVEFYASAQPIHDSSGQFVGAVVLMKDLVKVRKMVEEVATPPVVTFSCFVGKSLGIKDAIHLAQRIAQTDATVSIRGESGTGKELFAGAIHFESGRKGPFIAINCAAMPESLLESELFGYADGAFTGARKLGKPGLFEVASGGTLFLDEIGEMAPGSQAKILRVLQEGLVRRIGGSHEISVDTRIITATHTNLEERVQQRRFREDLYYRINVVPVHIPPLRARREDIPPLARHFLTLLTQKLGKAQQTISGNAMEKLIGHPWPGNVRELKNVIERGAILGDGKEVHTANILFSHEVNATSLTMEATPVGEKSLKELTAQFETELIARTLKSEGSIRKAAMRLATSHTTLINKIKKHGIQVEPKRSIGTKEFQ